MTFSLIVPVYNRPDEIQELLQSISETDYTGDFEIIIVEDGSIIDCKKIVDGFEGILRIRYFAKQNSGPGDSRNFGISMATSDYFLLFDSDCIIPKDYLKNVSQHLKSNYVDCFGGTDCDMPDFTPVQKAINYAMTSILTTGGVRGGSEKTGKFQPRSFNMGISKKAFEASGGFGNIHPGEDPDLALRLWDLGFSTALFKNAFVYHKRRISWESFSLQVSKFGKVRPILDSWHPKHQKLSYWFPSFFSLGLIGAFVLAFFGITWPCFFYAAYFLILIVHAIFVHRSINIGIMSAYAALVQFWNYGFGFLESFVMIRIFGQKPEDAFPKLFFTKK